MKYVFGTILILSLESVINRYKGEQIVEGYTLGPPVMKVVNLKFMYIFFIYL